jgi:coenzyme F420-reducing hydrogenase delta subunit
MEDIAKENKLENDLKNEDNLQLREGNERMNRKNEMIREYVKDLKIERTRNVDFVQDTNVVRREVVQER